MTPIIIQTTYPTKEEGKKLAEILIRKKLAACVQITKIDSVYSWDDRICEDKEYILNIKTKKENYPLIEREIKENHSYDLPEIISIKINDLSDEYKNFIKESTT
jgi:periplasmic divalent cation tolerance protein